MTIAMNAMGVLVPAVERWSLGGAASLHAAGVVALGVDGRRVALMETRRWAPRRVLCGSAVAAAFVGDEAWVVSDGQLVRNDLRGEPIGAPVALPAIPARARLSVARSGAGCLLVDGAGGFAVHRAGDRAVVVALPAVAGARAALGPRSWVERRGSALVVQRGGRADTIALPTELATAEPRQAAHIGDTVIAVELRGSHRHAVVVLDLVAGAVTTRIGLEDVIGVTLAEQRAVAVASRADGITAIDLRRGRVLATGSCGPGAVIAIDAAARTAVLADADGVPCEIVHDLIGALTARPRRAAPAAPVVAASVMAEAARAEPMAEAARAEPMAEAARAEPPAEAVVPEPPASLAVREPPSAAEAAAPTALIAKPAAIPPPAPTLAALGPPCPPMPADELEAYGRAAVELLLAFAATAASDDDAERDALVAAERAAGQALARWNRPGTPHVELSRGLKLSPLATTILLAVAGPALDPAVAEAYQALGPRVDLSLLGHLLEANRAMQLELAAELDAGAPLRRSGAITVAAGALTCHPVVLQRLLGGALTVPPPGRLQHAERALADVRLAGDAHARLVAALAEAGFEPVRLVLRGRAGSGRRTTAAALAASVGRALATIELAGAADAADALAAHLAAAALADAIPCVGLDGLDDDPGTRRRIRAVLDGHLGPLIIRTPAATTVPLAPGHAAVELDTLDEAARAAAWCDALTAAGRPAGAAARLAARYRVGPGIAARVVARCAGASDDALEPALVEAVRQHRAGRLRDVATRVDRLAGWDDLVLPEDHLEGLHDLIARVRHAGEVLDDWGLGRIVTTSRGVTALFQGGPGTGKTMAAGVVARALGFELWRVDLSRVVSKWAGETEKNLAAVFDAAEDGEVAILFDEADSLFGKRTEVRSSHDRHANLEINYLLQRLDAFEGLAILTTNFGTAIDPAFRRRFAVQLQLGFPDEDDRLRLWRAHLPATVPQDADLALADLAHDYAMSGGAIRNAVLRAAYRAAADRTPITSAGLRRAVAAEYRDRGQVSTTSLLA
jgi:ATPase family protein associated with various cellular activities (AAA)